MPRVEDILAKLGKAKYFTTLDLRSGYHHIALDKQSIKKTAFCTSFGKYEYLKVPFGLAQAPSYFQKLMNKVLNGLNFAFAYLDDIIIFSNTAEEHLKHIQIVINRLKSAQLKLKKSKCSFFKKELYYLGHLLTTDGIKPQIEKVKAIHEMRPPTNPKGVREFLGMVGYYRKFINRFADAARPLTKLTHVINFQALLPHMYGDINKLFQCFVELVFFYFLFAHNIYSKLQHCFSICKPM